MSQETPNPFALPGMSAAFMNTPNNPLLTSMEMMRQAMGNMGYGSKSGSTDTMVNPMAPEELEKRIGELRVVENWLKLNLSMLSSSIQGMEVQLATVKTLQSFVAMGQSVGSSASAEASPLEVALGLKPAPKGTAAKPSASQRATASEAQTKSQPNANASASGSNQQQAAAEGWWNMLENQFAQIAAATANAAKMSNEALQATTQAASGNTPKKAAAPKSRPAKKATKSARTPKKEA